MSLVSIQNPFIAYRHFLISALRADDGRSLVVVINRDVVPEIVRDRDVMVTI